MARDWGNEPADLVYVMMRTFHIDRFTAESHINHGLVSISGYTICMLETRMWRKRSLAGKVMVCPEGQVRLYGTTAATSEVVNEQLKFGSRG
jgi:hypothetical protein